MKVCIKCNAHYEDDIFFCLQDGTPLEITDTVRISEDNPNFIGDEPKNFSSEQTFIKNGPIAADNKSEVTVVRPNAIDSEATKVRPNPIGINIPIAEQVSHSKNSTNTEVNFSSSNSNSKSILKITALVSVVSILFAAVFLAFFNTPQNLSDTKELVEKKEDYPSKMKDTDSESDTKQTPEPTVEKQNLTIRPEDRKEDKETASKIDEQLLDDDSIFADELLKKTPAPTPKPIKKGEISGKLTYPGHGIPSNFHICVREIKKNITACSNSKKPNFEFKVNRSAVNYSINLPDGTYHIYATVPGQPKAYYTQFVRCGMDVKCKSHSKIPIKVSGGKTVGGIMVGDWYDF